LHAINKGDTPLPTLHVDHLGLLDMTSKSFRYIFAIADGFNKYTWLFPTKSTNADKNNFDKKRKGQLCDLVAIKVTQFITGKKLANKYVGPDEGIQVKRKGRYDVKKAADFEGPLQTTNSADFVKLWPYGSNEEEDENLSTERTWHLGQMFQLNSRVSLYQNLCNSYMYKLYYS